ncbi:hypothetical protein WMY93_000635 [Mugilogobius chulae]|uniref:C-type lectin domain-containing protein n=1 Tax=Mugilogobius chulae TaxID=88201 RepID=A0AAW0QAH5_9GOBI
MDQSLWISVLLGQLCFCVCQDHKYRFISEPKSWTEAQEFCRRRYIDLVTVNNMSDLQALRAAVDGQPDAWIGLYLTSEIRKWHWSQPELTYSYPKPDVWWAGRPKDELVRNCGVLTSKNTWYDTLCDTQDEAGFVCYNKSSNDVFKIDLMYDWLDSQLYCRTHHTDLLSGLTQYQQFITKYPTRIYGFRMGLFRDSWGWSDGSNSSFRNMKTEVNPQTKKCAALTSDGRWASEDCGLEKPFICYGEASVRVTLHNLAQDVPLKRVVLWRGLLQSASLKPQRKRQKHGAVGYLVAGAAALSQQNHMGKV